MEAVVGWEVTEEQRRRREKEIQIDRETER